MSTTAFERIESGAIEGRAQNFRGRQLQLRSLFAHLTAHQDDFVEALKVEETCSTGEAQTAVAAMLLDF